MGTKTATVLAGALMTTVAPAVMAEVADSAANGFTVVNETVVEAARIDA